jgi:hypothetical protein
VVDIHQKSAKKNVNATSCDFLPCKSCLGKMNDTAPLAPTPTALNTSQSIVRTFLDGGPVFNSNLSLFLIQITFLLVLSRALGWLLK